MKVRYLVCASPPIIEFHANSFKTLLMYTGVLDMH